MKISKGFYFQFITRFEIVRFPMDLLLLAIRTSRPIFVREGGGRGVEECHCNSQ